MKLLALSLILLLAACTKAKNSPEASLKSFVESRIGNTVTRAFVVEHTAGKMRESLTNMSDADFEKFADMRNIKEDSFKIISKTCQPTQCYLTYSISYRTKDEKDKTLYSSEVKKIAELLLEDDKWLISDVTNIKTYHESSDAIQVEN